MDSRKDEIDLFYSDDEYLTTEDKLKRANILLEQDERGIPDKILDMFKVVSKADKITVYDQISILKNHQHQQLRELIQKVNMPNHIGVDWDGLQVILDSVLPIVSGQLAKLIVQKTNQGEGDHSILVPMLHNYLEQGFSGLVSYRRNSKGETRDQATRNTARFVYNTAKYQLVKYFGVFNVMYKFYRSKSGDVDFEDVSGIDRLLTKLEYNALTEIGRLVSDYGVPAKVLQYYEDNQSTYIKNSFDDFEKKSFDSVDGIINR